eukprot:9059623-Alexandrium_andersonii.AAC.1
MSDFEAVWINPAYQVRGVALDEADDDLPGRAALSPRQTHIAGELTPSGVVPGPVAPPPARSRRHPDVPLLPIGSGPVEFNS